jgi:acyl dehydratase
VTESLVPSAYRVRARNIAPDSDNKIHDDDVAQQFGFSGALVPGVDLFAYITHPLVEAWGVDFLTHGRIDVRFRRPVYDGDDVEVRVEPADQGSFATTLAGPDGEPRAVGTAWPAADDVGDLSRFARHPAPAMLLPPGPERLPLGALGSVAEPVDESRHDAYLHAIDESLPLYREHGLVHPGALLRIVNELLMRNVALGPWIHTASACRLLAPATLPATLRADGIVTECFERNGNAYVRYDALVRCDDLPVTLVDHTAIYRLAG